jgi:hypothetical protein
LDFHHTSFPRRKKPSRQRAHPLPLSVSNERYLVDSVFDSAFGSLGVAPGELGLAELEAEDDGEDGEADGGVGADDELELDEGPESARGDIGVVDEDEDDEPDAPGLPGAPSRRSQPASATAPTASAMRSLVMEFFMGGVSLGVTRNTPSKHRASNISLTDQGPGPPGCRLSAAVFAAPPPSPR